MRRGAPEGTHVDVALLDSIAVTMAMMPSIFASMSGWNPLVWTTRSIEVPSIEPTADGYANFTTNSAQQFSDFCVMIGHPDLLETTRDRTAGRALRRRVRSSSTGPRVHTKRTTRGGTRGRRACSASPPGRHSTARRSRRSRSSSNGACSSSTRASSPRGSPTGSRRLPVLPVVIGHDPFTTAQTTKPLEGIRVVDCTAWWAGPAWSRPTAAAQEWEKVLAAQKGRQSRHHRTRRGSPLRRLEDRSRRTGITVEHSADRGSGIGPRLSAERGAGQYLGRDHWHHDRSAVASTRRDVGSDGAGARFARCCGSQVMARWGSGLRRSGKAFPGDDAVATRHPFCQPKSYQAAGNQITKICSTPNGARRSLWTTRPERDRVRPRLRVLSAS